MFRLFFLPSIYKYFYLAKNERKKSFFPCKPLEFQTIFLFYLFSAVGTTMQEDFGFLNANNCYSEKPSTSTPNPTELDLDPTHSSAFVKTTSQAVKIKLEESSPDVNKWPFNYGINFLWVFRLIQTNILHSHITLVLGEHRMIQWYQASIKESIIMTLNFYAQIQQAPKIPPPQSHLLLNGKLTRPNLSWNMCQNCQQLRSNCNDQAQEYDEKVQWSFVFIIKPSHQNISITMNLNRILRKSVMSWDTSSNF